MHTNIWIWILILFSVKNLLILLVFSIWCSQVITQYACVHTHYTNRQGVRVLIDSTVLLFSIQLVIWILEQTYSVKVHACRWCSDCSSQIHAAIIINTLKYEELLNCQLLHSQALDCLLLRTGGVGLLGDYRNK